MMGPSSSAGPLSPTELTEPTEPTEATVAAYRATNYRVCDGAQGVVLRIGDGGARHAGWLARHAADSATVLTAWNPFGAAAAAAVNTAAAEQLRLLLADSGLRHLPAVNQDPTGRWPDEAGYCVFALDALTLDRWLVRFGQHAAVHIARGASCHLVWHPSLGTGRSRG